MQNFHIGPVNSKQVSASSKTQYTINNLIPDTEYGVWVQAESLTTLGNSSLMVTGRPTNNGTYRMLSLPHVLIWHCDLDKNDSMKVLTLGRGIGRKIECVDLTILIKVFKINAF